MIRFLIHCADLNSRKKSNILLHEISLQNCPFIDCFVGKQRVYYLFFSGKQNSERNLICIYITEFVVLVFISESEKENKYFVRMINGLGNGETDESVKSLLTINNM